MNKISPCPQCQSPYVYKDRDLLICPECAYEWEECAQKEALSCSVVRDANGVELKDGDTVSVIKDLKVKGSSSVIKVGTKVKNIRLVDSDHNIDCKLSGIGQMGLKSEFVKKVIE